MRRSDKRRSGWSHPLVASILAVGLCATTVWAPAAIPQEFSYQAYLTDPIGQPITATSVDVDVSFWDAPVAGTQLGTTQSFSGLNLLNSRGFVNLTVPTASLAVGDLNNDVYIEITIDSGGGPETLAPRQKIVPAPTALNADRLDGLDSSAFVTLAGAQTIAGAKTFTAIQRVDATGVSTSASGTTGAAFSVIGTNHADAWRAIGTRGAITQTGTAEPGGAPPAPLTSRQIQGVVGVANGQGGVNTTLAGGYFIGKLLSSSTTGALLITGVSADAEAESGATLTAAQTLIGGRFGVDNSTTGAATTIGAFAASLSAGPTLGPATGLVGIGGGSVSANVGVLAAANADPFALPGLIAPNLSAAGTGLYAFNNIPTGVALLADKGGAAGNALVAIGPSALQGDVAITGKATQSVLTPTAPGDLATKSYVDSAFGNVTRTWWVVPAGSGSATPDGSLAHPYDNLLTAYADAKTIGGSFFNRVAIILTPGQHSIAGQLVMDTVGVDIVGFGALTTHLNVAADPGILITAPTSGATIANLNINGSAAPATNVLVDIQGGARLRDVALRRSGTAGTLLNVALPATQTASLNGFEILGNVTISSYGAQTAFSRGYVTGTITSTGTSATTEFLGLSDISGLGGLSFAPATFGILGMSNVAQCFALSVNSGTVLRASTSNFATAAGVPLAIGDPAAGSAVVNCTGDTSGWTGVLAASGGNIPTLYTAFTLK
ncbi:MAG: hypothetical protein KF858_04710 [Candidatus Sumerlaeia bacterium]|nr:hypothetical protein [Candidatus Sumerlaeia bacterium]